MGLLKRRIIMKLYCANPQDLGTTLVRTAALMTGTKVQFVTADETFLKSAEYKKMAVTDKLPMLVTSEGSLQDPTAIAKYFCALAGNKHVGVNAVQRSQVDQWVSFNNSTLAPLANAVNRGT